jgi:hypothetical protein
MARVLQHEIEGLKRMDPDKRLAARMSRYDALG